MLPETRYATWWTHVVGGDASLMPDDCVAYIPASAEDVRRVGPGWCSRFARPGYLDATDWIGVFETEAEALDALEEDTDEGL